jgi:hypothetical protein
VGVRIGVPSDVAGIGRDLFDREIRSIWGWNFDIRR